MGLRVLRVSVFARPETRPFVKSLLLLRSIWDGAGADAARKPVSSGASRAARGPCLRSPCWRPAARHGKEARPSWAWPGCACSRPPTPGGCQHREITVLIINYQISVTLLVQYMQ